MADARRATILATFRDAPAPCWFNAVHHTLAIAAVDPMAQVLQLRNKSASLALSLVPGRPARRRWFIQWSICHAEHEEVQGTTWWSTNDVRQAFALDGEAAAGQLGRYIRRHHFLNVPCRGTGADGDPNLSLQLTDEIQAAVRQLLRRSKQ